MGEINTGHFYFLNDDYFKDFPDPKLAMNKEGKLHGRPCFYALLDDATKIFWMVPISSKIEKYKTRYEEKIAIYGKCDTLAFGDVLGQERAFLIQNLCPTLPKYITAEYIDSVARVPVRVNGAFEEEVIRKVKIVLALTRKGKKLVFPDILKIENELKKQSR